MSYRVSHWQGMVLVFAGGLVWSLNGLLLRLVGDAGTWQVLFYRSLGMAPVLLLWISMASGGRSISAIRAAGWSGVIGGLGLVFAFAGSIYSMQATTIANAVFLFAAAPLITAALARPILGERVRPITKGAIALALVGIFLMVREGLAVGAGWGNVAALISASGFSAFTLTLRWARLSDATPAILVGAALACVVAALVIWTRGESLTLPLRGWGIAMAMGAVTITGGMALFTTGARAIPASEAGLLALTEVMLAPFWVWLFWNETTSRDTLIGGAVLLAALILNALGTGWDMAARARATAKAEP